MYRDVLIDTTRNLSLFDDWALDDYRARDGIFANTFNETDKNGVYLVTAGVRGQKQNGQPVERSVKGSFQVGSIERNPVTTSQIRQYMGYAESQMNQTQTRRHKPAPQHDTESGPAQKIEQLQGGSPLDTINELLKEQ